MLFVVLALVVGIALIGGISGFMLMIAWGIVASKVGILTINFIEAFAIAVTIRMLFMATTNTKSTKEVKI